MSELTLFQNGSQLPAHLKRGELSDLTRSLMGTSTKRISLEGGVFRLIVGGQEVAKNENRSMNIVVVRAAPANSRTFYAEKYVKGTKARPICWSEDGKAPHASVKTPQASVCEKCPQNIKGSGDRPDTRACRFQRRLAVLLENDMDGDIYAMTIPPQSIFGQGEGRKMGLQQYARFLGGHGIEVNSVVTELRFDTEAEGVKVTFSAVRPLEETEYHAVVSRKDEPAAIDAVTMTVGEMDGAPEDGTPAPAPAPAPAPMPVFSATPAAPVAAPKPTPKPTPAPSAFKATKPAPAPVAAPAPAPVEEPAVREAKAPAPAVPDVSSILSQWGDDADD